MSVVIPIYRDELSIRENFLELQGVLDQHRDSFRYEVILVNDGSPDGSWLVLEQIRQEFPDVVGIVNLIRNFGQVAATLAGINCCSGDCIAVISSDLQDPPNLIPVMFQAWQSGAQTVIGVRESREDPWIDKVSSRIFYSLIARYVLPSLPERGFDFFLLDRTVANRLIESHERNGFLQGQILSVTSSVATIAYQRRKRKKGRSGWTFFKKLKYSVDAFVAYSFIPLRFISLLGVLLFVLGFALSVLLAVQRLVYGTKAIGWSSVMIAMLLLHGTEMLILGVMGEYMWRTLDQVRNRPLYIIDYQHLPSNVKLGDETEQN